MPNKTKKAGVKVIATGRSDFPNQLNNSQVFPGVFRGALDNNIRQITDKMKRGAAHAIASLVPKPTANSIVPGMFDPKLVKTVAKEMRN